MKNFLIAFFICIVWSFFALWLYSWLVPGNTSTSILSNFSPTTVSETSISSEILNATNISEKREVLTETKINLEDSVVDEIREIKKNIFGLSAITPENDIVFRFEDGISFTKNATSLEVPKTIQDFKYKTNTYLIEHPQTEVHIISRYSATENFETPNLGIQRGVQIKNLLTELGIDSKRIVVKSSIEELEFSEDNTYANAIAIEFKPLNEDRIAAIVPEAPSIPDAITFYPRISETGIIKSEKLDELLETVKVILDKNPAVKVTIIGHTDNSGNANENFKLGLTYAEEIRWYFVAKGKMDRTRIKAVSRGEVQPIRSNRTARGRRANRRVELQFE